ncbi:hypothetical protein SMACR_09317 [Sordaria macrospora]|uniref:WGS project CABT00000000 data, contig 2.84 n=2 Tax=Sordaria macrospora TaxID=5147 RepID=F7WBT2_SORMK|nr:uncharacterized protein SMAC_09317 [Sordaria macrospora k-hell]KAA8630081.1 hypothetical protein SMACR_09317 [Sordaria macrospora]WPJ62796.1 hypothetical protein SMAC4_09317 [Sordaria macrospora]CCC14475.1 unnamed protein product [Sordaria macrospora k-hell]
MRLTSLFLPLGLLVTLSAAQESSAASAAEPTSTAAATSASIPPTSSSPPTSRSVPPSGTSSSKPSATATVPGPSGTNYGPKGPPDVLLRVPELHVGRIELDVDNLRAEINLAAEVASLVTLNAGVQVGIDKVNITIADVDAQLDLVIRLGNLVKVVNRTLSTLDLNPALVNLLDGVVDAVDGVIGAVDGLLGTVLGSDGNKVNFLIDNLGNIVQEVVGVAGEATSTIVGSYLKNMTFTGTIKDLGNGLTQKTYKYDALGSLVNVVTNALGQVVQAVVVGAGGGGGGGGSSTSSGTAAPTSTKPASSTTATSVAATSTA